MTFLSDTLVQTLRSSRTKLRRRTVLSTLLS